MFVNGELYFAQSIKIPPIQKYFRKVLLLINMELTKRSLLKTITWRITASLDTFVIAWIITGDWKMGGSIAGIEVITKMFFYYFHERIWNKINWGKRKWWWLT